MTYSLAAGTLLTTSDIPGAYFTTAVTHTSTDGAVQLLDLSLSGIAAGQIVLYGMSGTMTLSGTDHVQFGNGVDVHASDFAGGNWSISGVLIYKNSSGDCYVEDRFLGKGWTDVEVSSFSAVTDPNLTIECYGSASLTIDAGYLQRIK